MHVLKHLLSFKNFDVCGDVSAELLILLIK